MIRREERPGSSGRRHARPYSTENATSSCGRTMTREKVAVFFGERLSLLAIHPPKYYHRPAAERRDILRRSLRPTANRERELFLCFINSASVSISRFFSVTVVFATRLSQLLLVPGRASNLAAPSSYYRSPDMTLHAMHRLSRNCHSAGCARMRQSRLFVVAFVNACMHADVALRLVGDAHAAMPDHYRCFRYTQPRRMPPAPAAGVHGVPPRRRVRGTERHRRGTRNAVVAHISSEQRLQTADHGLAVCSGHWK